MNRPAIERMTAIAKLLRQGARVTTLIIACRFEVDRRTVTRDIEFMRDRLGYGIEWRQGDLTFHLTSAPEPVL